MNKYAGTQSEKNLMTAFAGESEARNKYTFFASVAKKQGFEQIAALFLKTADNEKEHAKLWFKELNGIGDTPWSSTPRTFWKPMFTAWAFPVRSTVCPPQQACSNPSFLSCWLPSAIS